MSGFDLSTRWGRLRAVLNTMWADHSFLRVSFTNAHWLDGKMIRAAQPWPFHLKWWARDGVKTIINLRGGKGTSFYELEKDACERYGLKLVDFTVTSRAVPTREQVLGARDLFASIQYPALMHCKSGADRAGLMSVLYRHFQQGVPIREAMKELGLRTLHVRQGKTGVLDYTFERYLTDAEPKGISFVDWVQSDAYDPKAIKADFQAGFWATLLTDKILRRE